MKTALIYASLIGLVMSASTAQAQVKKCVDSAGKITYTHAYCPKETHKEQTVMSHTPTTSATTSQEKDWREENKNFNRREAQRERIRAAEARDQAAIDTFNKATSRPLAPGERRTTTLNLGGSEKTVTSPN